MPHGASTTHSGSVPKNSFPTPPAKRRRIAPPRSSGKSPQTAIDLTYSSDAEPTPPTKKTIPIKKTPTKQITPTKRKKPNVLETPKAGLEKTSTATPHRPKKSEEKRARPFRGHAPKTYLDRYSRAISQRMFVISRTRLTQPKLSSNPTLPPPPPEETLDIAGTTGNIYNVHIGTTPSCTCPDAGKGNQCKHIIYALAVVLKAPEHLCYQLAFLTAELELIFAGAPPITSGNAGDGSSGGAEEKNADGKSRRKPIEGDCPICFMELADGEEGQHKAGEDEDVVWCRASCGQNIHRACFEQWARSQSGGREVRCVYCRAVWQGDEASVASIFRAKAQGGVKNADGYVNVARELGLSDARDYSSYHQPWARRNGFVPGGRGGAWRRGWWEE